MAVVKVTDTRTTETVEYGQAFPVRIGSHEFADVILRDPAVDPIHLTIDYPIHLAIEDDGEVVPAARGVTVPRFSAAALLLQRAAEHAGTGGLAVPTRDAGGAEILPGASVRLGEFASPFVIGPYQVEIRLAELGEFDRHSDASEDDAPDL